MPCAIAGCWTRQEQGGPGFLAWLPDDARTACTTQRPALRRLRRADRCRHGKEIRSCPPCSTTCSLSLGIGGTTGMFSLVDAVVLRPLPYPGEDRIVMVWDTEPAEVSIK